MSGGTNLSDGAINNGGTVNTYLTNDAGHAILVRCTTANIPSAVANFAVGCQLEDTTTGILYVNTGTTTSCTFTKASLAATGNKGYYSVTKAVAGTANTNVFGTTNGFASTVTGMLVSALGATSQTVTLKGVNGATIATTTTSSSVGGVTGPSSAGLTNTALTSAGTLTVSSGSASDTSLVTVFFTVP